MQRTYRFDRLEKTIAHDKRLLFTLCSFALTLGIYINLSFFQSPVIGVVASVLYFIINGVFLGHAFFEKETAFFRLMFGTLLLVMLLGFVGWLAVIIHNLDVTRFTLVLLITATLSSLLNRRVKNKNVA
jgi:hypothetical protein